MTLSTVQVAHLLMALGLITLSAHTAGYLFGRLRQPPVLGEVVGGLLLGPTVLGALAPDAAAWLSPAAGPVAAGLDLVGQLGLLLLMFLASAELRVRAGTRERRTAAVIAVTGLVVPFAAGVLVVTRVGYRDFAGPRGSAVSLALVFGIATAVAAIPVISRIMMDLGVLDTAFGRIVLMVAVAEDAVLYIVLAVTLGLAEGGSDQAYGLWAAVGTDATTPTVLYYLAVSLAFFAVGTAWGPRLFRWLAGRRWNVLDRRHPVAFRLLLLSAAVSGCVGLGLNPIFGALLAGLSAARGDAGLADVQVEGRALHAWEALRQFALAFFIPVYFALVGMRLDLIRQLDPLFFGWFLLLACAVKAASVWSAARLAGADRTAATRFAVALNARGTPGVLLATVTLAAGLINERFFAVLVLVSLVTCQIAGFWLDRSVRGTAGPAGQPQPHHTLDAKEIA